MLRSGLFALAGSLLLTAACTPDIHIHIYNDTGGTDTQAGGMPTDDGTPDDTGGADGMPPTTTATTAAPGEDDGPPATTGPMTTGPSDDGSSSGGGSGDEYPAPRGDACPDGTVLSQPDAGYEFCAPECMGGACPPPSSGNAAAACVFNPSSSNTPCEPGDGTCMGEESCTVIPGGSMGCALVPSHCALLCSEGQMCPTGMECSPIGACLFPR